MNDQESMCNCLKKSLLGILMQLWLDGFPHTIDLQLLCY